ncbi:MAG: aldo/keto reductase [Capsulimonadaceae bacterium]
MQYTNLGRTGLKVSRLCLGTMNFGPVTTEDDSHAIMDHALELGVNFFDTADVYGWKRGEGITEKIIGRWFAQGGGRRDKCVIATKVYGDMGDTELGMGEWPNTSRLSKLHIRRALDKSLQRLQTDYIDLYQMHHVWRESTWEEIWEAFELAHQQGKVLYFGSSNFAGWHIAQANEAARNRHFLGLVSEQCHYNLNTRLVELEVIPAAVKYGMGIIPWSPLAGGMLGGVLQKVSEGRRATPDQQRALERNRGKLERYEALCKDLGEKPADVAMAWVIRNPAVTAPIVGPRTIEQLDGALHALGMTLSDETVKTLDEIWPGPGGMAPEAWAW